MNYARVQMRPASVERAAVQSAPVRFNIPVPPDIDAFLSDAREILESGMWLEEPADRAPLVHWLTAAGIETRLCHSIAIPDLSSFKGRVDSVDRVIESVASFYAER